VDWLENCVVVKERSPLKVLIWAELPWVYLPYIHPQPLEEMLVREKVRKFLAAWWHQVLLEEILR